MPELPEVETIRQGLITSIQHKVISQVTIRCRKLRMPIPETLTSFLCDKPIHTIGRRAKYLIFDVGSQEGIVIHLGMSGRLRYFPKAREPVTHDHVSFYDHDGGELVFNDPRRFGLVTLVSLEKLNEHPLFQHLGLEPLSEAFTKEALFQKTRTSRTPIKIWLMDQRHVVGVGNIYAAESLFLSKIHPLRPASSLTFSEASLLVESVKKVLEKAIAAGGSTLRDYQKSNGELGYFQHQFQVYDQKGNPCSFCQHPVERLVMSGRSTYFCPLCQV